MLKGKMPRFSGNRFCWCVCLQVCVRMGRDYEDFDCNMLSVWIIFTCDATAMIVEIPKWHFDNSYVKVGEFYFSQI